jgi:hypothetical protein
MSKRGLISLLSSALVGVSLLGGCGKVEKSDSQDWKYDSFVEQKVPSVGVDRDSFKPSLKTVYLDLNTRGVTKIDYSKDKDIHSVVEMVDRSYFEVLNFGIRTVSSNYDKIVDFLSLTNINFYVGVPSKINSVDVKSLRGFYFEESKMFGGLMESKDDCKKVSARETEGSLLKYLRSVAKSDPIRIPTQKDLRFFEIPIQVVNSNLDYVGFDASLEIPIERTSKEGASVYYIVETDVAHKEDGKFLSERARFGGKINILVPNDENFMGEWYSRDKINLSVGSRWIDVSGMAFRRFEKKGNVVYLDDENLMLKTIIRENGGRSDELHLISNGKPFGDGSKMIRFYREGK